MAEPTYDAATEHLYARLPMFYRDADANRDYVFKKWLSGVAGLFATELTLYDRIEWTTRDSGGAAGETSHLADPAKADGLWLPWMAQFLGIKLNNTPPGLPLFSRDMEDGTTTGFTAMNGATLTCVGQNGFGPPASPYAGRRMLGVSWNGTNPGSYATCVLNYPIKPNTKYTLQGAALVLSSTNTESEWGSDAKVTLAHHVQLIDGVTGFIVVPTGQIDRSVRPQVWQPFQISITTGPTTTALFIRLYGAGSDAAYYDNIQLDEGDALPFGKLPEYSYAAQRTVLANAGTAWRAGSKDSIKAAAQTVLTGSKYCVIYDHTTNTSGIGTAAQPGAQWQVCIVTKAGEGPASAVILDAVAKANVKPAGVVLYHREYVPTWATLASAYPTWGTTGTPSPAGDPMLSGKTWKQIELAGLP